MGRGSWHGISPCRPGAVPFEASDHGHGGGCHQSRPCGVPRPTPIEVSMIRHPTLDKALPPHAAPSVRSQARLEAIADLLDSRWRIPGTGIRFGADALLSLVPGLGPVVSTVIS